MFRLLMLLVIGTTPAAAAIEVDTFPVPQGAHPHDVAPQPGGGPVWYTAQHQGALGRLDPNTGETRHIPLGEGSRPHGVIVGPDGHALITDSGLNAIVRVNSETLEVTSYALPEDTGYANLNTAAFDGDGDLWFTGQAGIYRPPRSREWGNGGVRSAAGTRALRDCRHSRGRYLLRLACG